jgi:peroxisomal membrane protein 2
MALYGFFISAPLGHFLVGALQKAFAGKTGTAAKIGQIVASNLLIAPIQAASEFLLFQRRGRVHLIFRFA